jgi:L-iditol 2-dehydrogenase
MNLPKTCKAAVLSEYGKPLEIQEVAIPEVKPNEVLVKVQLAGICGTDVHSAAGTLGMKFPLPQILGHETIGKIVKLGEGRVIDVAGEALKVGDRIMWSHTFCGECYWCTIRKQQYTCVRPQGYGFSNPSLLAGGFAEYELINAKTPVVKVPEELTDEEVVGVGCAFRTVVNAFEKLQKTSPIGVAETVVIQGCGPIGLYSLAMAITSGAGQTIVIGAPQARLELAKKWGATHIINMDEIKDPGERQKIVLSLTSGRGAETVIECTGVPQAFNEGFGLLMKGGTYLIEGITSPKTIEFMPYHVIDRNATVVGTSSADITHFYKALQFIKHNRHKFSFADIVSTHYELEDINLAMENMRLGKDIKPVIDCRNR